MGNDNYTEILSGKVQLGPYPMERLTKIDKPTILVTDEITRFDEREMGIARLRRGDLGIPGSTRSPVTGSSPSLSMTLMSALNPGGVSAEPAEEKIELPDNPSIISRHIKSMAYFVGADVVGICELPQWAVYSHDSQGNEIELNHKYAICIAVDQGCNTMDASDGNDWISSAQSGRGYAMCGYMGNIVASYIRSMGYPARLHSIRGYQVVVPPLLLLSGIGEMSRANIVLNPFLGLRFKASVVTTDLPLKIDSPVDFGLQDFCDKCMKCADECPSRSISSGQKIFKNGYENWEFNADTCTRYRFQNPKGVSCGRCIKVCPWNKPEGWTHDLVRWMVERAPALNSFFIKMDNMYGYGKADTSKKWWFDP
ncbi:reductive dehalogenase [Chloroflexota bacterium]